MSATIRYYNKFVNVIPVSGRVYVDRCLNWWVTSFPGVVNCYNIAETKQCGHVTIPPEHYSDDYIYFYPTNDSAIKIPGGQGILNTDLMLYVSYSNESCGSTTLAHATSCSHDQYGRPVTGTVNICPNMLSGSRYWKQDIVTMVHEVAHVLVMSPSLWSIFRDSNGDIIPLSSVIDQTDPMGDSLSYIISPKVRQLARDYFNCPTLAGLPLENNGGDGSALSHWDEKYARTEIMTAQLSTSLMYFSDFTVALMEDSGWYYVNYYYSEPFYWGKNAGCELWSEKCVNPTTHISNFDQFFCHGTWDWGCSYDYAAPAACHYGPYGYSLPTEFQYFSQSNYGGSQYADYCPFRNPDTTNNDYESVCWDIRGNIFTPDNYTSQNYAINSRCVDIIDTGNAIYNQERGFCFEHQCFGYDSINKQWDGVSIKISPTQNINCTRTDQPGYTTLTTKAVSSINGVDIKCPNIDAICGSSSEPFVCYWGNYNDDLSQCICSPGYTGSNCNTEDTSLEPDAIIPPGKEPTLPPTDPLSNTLCVEGITGNFAGLNGEYTYDGIWNFYPNWKVTGQNLYVSWNIFQHIWQIANEPDGGYYAKCNISAWTQDITKCHGNWYIFDGANSMIPNTNVMAYMGTCGNPVSYSPTKSPTITPTKTPTKSPTNNPSSSPTISVTKSPTITGYTYPPTTQPTEIPSKTPSVTPSKTPSKSPSKYPTLNPSITPTKSPSINPSKYPTKYPSITPSVFPSNTPTIPSKQPTNIPSEIPTISPTKFLFRREFLIELEYINETIACNFSLFINEVLNFRINDLNSFLFDIDEVYIINNINESLIEIKYKISTNISDEILDEIEIIINETKYKQLLIDDLELMFDCINFKFIGFTTTHITNTEITEMVTEINENNGNDDEIKLLDWKNYNNTELAIVGGIGLIVLLFICIIFYCCVKKCCCKDRENTKRFKHNSDARTVVEFNGFQSKPKPKQAVFSDEFLDVNNKKIQNSNRRASDGAQWLEI